MVAVDDDVGDRPDERLDELVRRLNVFETGEGDGVLYARVVRVEGDDVFDAHAHKLLQRDRAVEGFARRAAVLTAFVEHGHDDRNAAGLAGCGADDAL